METALWCALVAALIFVGGTVLAAAMEWTADRDEGLSLDDLLGPEEVEES